MAKKNNLYIYLVILLIAFIWMVMYHSVSANQNHSVGISNKVPVFISSETVGGVSTKYLPEVVVDTYGPPLRNDQPPINVDFYHGYPRNSTDERGAIPIHPVPVINQMEGLTVVSSAISCPLVPINIETRGIPREFTQVGILKTKKTNRDNILSLFGRQLMTSGDKWQYYTLSNHGIMPTRLPIHVKQNGGAPKDAMYEYGVDRLYTDDHVIVDGYDEEYIVQIYEPRQYRYIG